MSFIRRRCRKPTPRRMSVRDLPVLRSELLEVLSELSRDRFFVEYNVYFSCHLLQSAVALHGLGTSKEKFSAFVEHYVLQLESPDGRTRKMQDDLEQAMLNNGGDDEDDQILGTTCGGKTMMDTTTEELKGSRRGYYKLRQHYTILYQNKFVDEAIGEFLSRVMPDLADGISAASLHCLEDIGYALSIGHAQGAVDAVAYLHHSHNPLVRQVEESNPKTEFGHGDVKDLVGLFSLIGEDFELVNAMRRRRSSTASHFSSSASSMHSDTLSSSNGLVRLAALRGTTFSASMTSTTSLTGSRRKNSTGVEERSSLGAMTTLLATRGDSLVDYANKLHVAPALLAAPDGICEWLTDQCIVVYLASESRNSLKLLHAVTSTWALSRLVHSLEENNVDLKMRLIQTHLCSLLALYVALNKPRLDMGNISKTELIKKRYWSQILDKVNTMPITTDEHAFKLAHVCYMRATATNEESDMENLYKMAATEVVVTEGFNK